MIIVKDLPCKKLRLRAPVTAEVKPSRTIRMRIRRHRNHRKIPLLQASLQSYGVPVLVFGRNAKELEENLRRSMVVQFRLHRDNCDESPYMQEMWKRWQNLIDEAA